MYVCVYVDPCVQCPLWSEEGILSSGTEVTVGCEPLCRWVLGTESWTSTRAISSFNLCAISPATYIFYVNCFLILSPSPSLSTFLCVSLSLVYLTLLISFGPKLQFFS